MVIPLTRSQARAYVWIGSQTGEDEMLKRSIAVAIASAFVACVAQAQAPATKTLKMQSSWPDSNTLQEHFKMFGERVDKLTDGGDKTEARLGGHALAAFEVLEAA